MYSSLSVSCFTKLLYLTESSLRPKWAPIQGHPCASRGRGASFTLSFLFSIVSGSLKFQGHHCAPCYSIPSGCFAHPVFAAIRMPQPHLPSTCPIATAVCPFAAKDLGIWSLQEDYKKELGIWSVPQK